MTRGDAVATVLVGGWGRDGVAVVAAEEYAGIWRGGRDAEYAVKVSLREHLHPRFVYSNMV
jgi:hypothetical protein